jgi:hypothetical protein
VTQVRISECNFASANFFTALRLEVRWDWRDTEMSTATVTAEKTRNRTAGKGDPTAKKLWAPALQHGSSCRVFFPR